MKVAISGIVFLITLLFLFQITLPFPFGTIFWLFFVAWVIWYLRKLTNKNKDSLLNYRRVDPINEKEKNQNDEVLRILKKKYIEEKISKEEYLEKKREFENI
jgi:CBS domain containing-hemolysin-like protein